MGWASKGQISSHFDMVSEGIPQSLWIIPFPYSSHENLMTLTGWGSNLVIGKILAKQEDQI